MVIWYALRVAFNVWVLYKYASIIVFGNTMVLCLIQMVLRTNIICIYFGFVSTHAIEDIYSGYTVLYCLYDNRSAMVVNVQQTPFKQFWHSDAIS